VKCPNCKEGDLVERISRRGVFFACNRYPKCEFAMNNRPVPRTCPKCHAPYLMEKETKREGHIELCNNPECDYRAPVAAPAAANSSHVELTRIFTRRGIARQAGISCRSAVAR
jgi:hypothetical protein